MRAWVWAGLALVMAGGAMSVEPQDQVVTVTPAQPQPSFDATLHISARVIALGIGFGWGRGVIHYEGVDQAFCVRGWSFGDFGVVHLDANGLVFKLRDLDDFGGRYLTISAGAAMISGESGAMLKNERGVTLQLETRLRGVRFNMGAGRLKFTLAGKEGCDTARGPSQPAAQRRQESNDG